MSEIEATDTNLDTSDPDYVQAEPETAPPAHANGTAEQKLVRRSRSRQEPDADEPKGIKARIAAAKASYKGLIGELDAAIEKARSELLSLEHERAELVLEPVHPATRAASAAMAGMHADHAAASVAATPRKRPPWVKPAAKAVAKTKATKGKPGRKPGAESLPSRIQVVLQRAKNPMRAGEIAEALGVERPKISQGLLQLSKRKIAKGKGTRRDMVWTIVG